MGFPEICSSRSQKKRIWKSLVFLSCLAGFLYQTGTFMKFYWAYPTSVNVVSTSPFNVVQPAITICSNNLLRRKFYCEKNKAACYFYNDTKLFCIAYPKYCRGSETYLGIPKYDMFTEMSNLSRSFLLEASNKMEMIEDCYKDVEGLLIPCRVEKVPFVAKDLPIPTFCFAIESQMNKPDSKDITYPTTFFYDVYLSTFPEEYFFHSDPVQMYAVVHNRKQVISPIRDGIILKGGFSYTIHIYLTEIIRLPHPYSTNCTDYISNWKKENGTGPLTELDCIEYCKLSTILAAGKCVDEHVHYSHSAKNLCDKGVETTTKGIIKDCSSKCKPACLEQIYEMKYEEMEYNSRFCNESDENCRTEFILLKISFRRFRLTRQIFVPKYTTIELFSYIGGFMGLWLGLSLVSFFDFLESLCLLTYFPIRRWSIKRH